MSKARLVNVILASVMLFIYVLVAMIFFVTSFDLFLSHIFISSFTPGLLIGMIISSPLKKSGKGEKIASVVYASLLFVGSFLYIIPFALLPIAIYDLCNKENNC